MINNIRSAAAALLIFCAGGVMSVIAAIPAAERLLPAETLFVFSIPDFAKLREQQNTQPQTQLWSDPAIKPFKDHFLKKLQEEVVTPLERDLGMSLDTFARLPQGQITLAITAPAAGSKGPGFVLLIDTRNESGLLKTNLAALKAKWVESGKSIKRETLRGIEFSVLPWSDGDLPEFLNSFSDAGEGDEEAEGEDEGDDTEEGAEIVFGQYESLLIAADSIKAAEQVAIRATGGSAPLLADQASFESSRISVFRESPLYAWANAKAVVDFFLKQSEDSEEENPLESVFNTKAIFDAAGLTALRSAALEIQLSPDGVSGRFSLAAPESERRGLLKLFPTSGKPALPPPFVPADVVKFQRIRVDGSAAWTTLRAMLAQISPDFNSSLDFMIKTANEAAQQKDPNFDLQKSFFGNIGDDFIVFEKKPRGTNAAELASAPSLFLIQSPQPEQLAAGFKAVLALMSPEASNPEERDFLGRKVYSIPVPSSPLSQPQAAGKLSYATSGGYLALSTDVSTLEEYLRHAEGEQKQLRERAGLNEAIARVGGGNTGWLSFEDQVETMRSAFELLKQSENAEPTMLAAGIPAFTPENPFQEWLDFSLLPPFERIAKYFSFTVLAGQANAEGISFQFFSPVPPELRK